MNQNWSDILMINCLKQKYIFFFFVLINVMCNSFVLFDQVSLGVTPKGPLIC